MPQTLPLCTLHEHFRAFQLKLTGTLCLYPHVAFVALEVTKLQTYSYATRNNLNQHGATQRRDLDEHLQGMSVVHILAFAQLSEIWVEGNESILCAEIERIINTPIDLRFEISLQLQCKEHNQSLPLAPFGRDGTILGEHS